jgi:hypothetical protein
MRFVFIILAATLLAGSNIVRADTLIETFDRGPALDGIITPAIDGPWELTIADGVAELKNGTDPNAIKFYKIDKLRGGMTPAGAALAVDVSGDFKTKNSAAGLLYQHDSASRSYLAFVVGSQRWTFYQRGPEGMRPRLTGVLPASKQATRRLRIQPDNQKLTLEIDGQRVGSVQIANMPGSGVGIVALSTGRFDFDNLAVVPKAP